MWLSSNAYIFDVFFHRICGYKMRMVRDGYYYHYYYMYGYCDHLDSLTFFHNVFFGPFVRYSLVGSFRLRSFFSLSPFVVVVVASFHFVFFFAGTFCHSFSLCRSLSFPFSIANFFSHCTCIGVCVLCIDVQSNVYKRYSMA